MKTNVFEYQGVLVESGPTLARVFQFGVYCSKILRVTALYGLKSAFTIEFCYWLSRRPMMFRRQLLL